MTTSSPVSRRIPAPSEPGTSGSGNSYAGPGGLRTSRSRRLIPARLQLDDDLARPRDRVVEVLVRERAALLDQDRLHRRFDQGSSPETSTAT